MSREVASVPTFRKIEGFAGTTWLSLTIWVAASIRDRSFHELQHFTVHTVCHVIRRVVFDILAAPKLARPVAIGQLSRRACNRLLKRRRGQPFRSRLPSFHPNSLRCRWPQKPGGESRFPLRLEMPRLASTHTRLPPVR